MVIFISYVSLPEGTIFFSWDNTKFINGWQSLQSFVEGLGISWKMLSAGWRKHSQSDFRCFLLLYSITFNLIWCTFETFCISTLLQQLLQSWSWDHGSSCKSCVSKGFQGWGKVLISLHRCIKILSSKSVRLWSKAVFFRDRSVDFETWTKINGGPN